MTVEPSEWTSSPKWMSYSTLWEAEACPLRWSIANSEYPELWTGQGYPLQIHISAVEGSIVHKSLETITSALVEAGCTSLSDRQSTEVLKTLGGLSEVVANSITKVLRLHDSNPRIEPRINIYKRTLLARIPDLRHKVQRHLRRLPICKSKSKRTDHGNQSISRESRLGVGTHTEATLRVPRLGWIGVVDVITISDKSVEIRDYKTGLPSEHHADQMRVYAWLWANDTQANPSGSLVNSLVISYDDHEVHIQPPDRDQLDEFEIAIQSRSSRVLASLSIDPPLALPSKDKCSNCHVRHLCDVYWHENIENRLTNQTMSTQLQQPVDVQLTVSTMRDWHVWNCYIHDEAVGPNRRLVLLRARDLPFEIQPLQRLRILNAQKVASAFEDSANDAKRREDTLTLLPHSEVYVVVDK